MKPDKRLRCMFLYVFLALTLHKQQLCLECVGATDQYKRFCYDIQL